MVVSLVVWTFAGLAAIVNSIAILPLNRYLNGILLIFWIVFSICVLGMREPWLGTDTSTYERIFDSIAVGDYEPSRSEYGFYVIVRSLAWALNARALFVVFELLFLIPFIYALRRFSKSHWPLLLFFYLGTFFYYNANINIIRSGAAMGIYIYGLSFLFSKERDEHRFRNGVIGLSICALSALIHYFNAVYFLLLLAALGIPQVRYAAAIWLCVTAAICWGVNPAAYFGDFAFAGDSLVQQRAARYLTEGTWQSYRSGVRWDFLLFTSVFLIFPLYFHFVKCYRNQKYKLLVKLYLLSSALFISAFYVPFSDRVGILSFFLIPFVVCFPLCDPQYQSHRKEQWIGFAAAISMGIFSFLYLPNMLL